MLSNTDIKEILELDSFSHRTKTLDQLLIQVLLRKPFQRLMPLKLLRKLPSRLLKLLLLMLRPLMRPLRRPQRPSQYQSQLRLKLLLPQLHKLWKNTKHWRKRSRQKVLHWTLSQHLWTRKNKEPLKKKLLTNSLTRLKLREMLRRQNLHRKKLIT